MMSEIEADPHSWEQLNTLVTEVLAVSPGAGSAHSSLWPVVLLSSIVQSEERLRAVKMLVDAKYVESSEIVTRSMFEMTATMEYIGSDPETLTRRYLEHGNVSFSSHEGDYGLPVFEFDVIEPDAPPPLRSWKPLRAVCDALGAEWPLWYRIYYPAHSVTAHAGSFNIGARLTRISDGHLEDPVRLPLVLFTALEFHTRMLWLWSDMYRGRRLAQLRELWERRRDVWLRLSLAKFRKGSRR